MYICITDVATYSIRVYIGVLYMIFWYFRFYIDNYSW